MTDLLPVSEAQSRIRAAFAPVSTTGVPLADALGRVLSAEIIAPLDLPPFTNSSMDGFAVRAADVAGASPSAPVTLALVAEIPAGAAPSAVIGPQQAARIMTGALLPAGADAVVPQEVTRSAPGVSAQVEILEPVRPGDYLRQQGSDLQAGVPLWALDLAALDPALNSEALSALTVDAALGVRSHRGGTAPAAVAEQLAQAAAEVERYR